MKPKFIFPLMLVAIFAFVSCSEKHLYKEDATEVYTPADFKMTQTYEVNVAEGTTKEVYVDGELVFSGNASLTIEIPKSIAATRGLSEYELVDTNKGNSGWTHAYKRGLLLFEDVTNGDNDYNDFVCEIVEMLELKFDDEKKSFDNVKYNVDIFPYAMGNRLTMQFGVELMIDRKMVKDILLSKNVREDFYNGEDGYINTIKDKEKIAGNDIPFKNYEANGTLKENFSVATNYYIIIDGEKRYVCDSSKAALTENGVPYGLFIPKSWEHGFCFQYVQEYMSFFKAYPNFMKWVKNESDKPFENPNKDYLY